MKKLLFILQILIPYIFLGIRLYSGCMTGERDIAILEHMDKIGFYLLIIICLINTTYPFIVRKRFQAKEMLFWAMIIKITAIPYYLIVFLIGIAAITTIRGIIFLPFLGLLNYIVLLPSSMIATNGLLLGKKNNQINNLEIFAFIILEFVFCLDLVATIYVHNKFKKSNA